MDGTEPDDDRGPVVVTVPLVRRRSGRARWVRLLLAVVAGAAVGVALSSGSGGNEAEAIVQRVGPQPGRIAVRVVDGPDPGPWTLAWPEDVRVGQTVTVELRGTCRCEPVHPRRSSLLPIVPALVTVILGLVVHLVVSRRHRARTAASRAALTAGPIGPVVRLRATHGRRGPFLEQRWELHPVAGGPPLGWVDLVYDPARFDPTVPFTVSGRLEPGGAVAVTSTDGRQIALPSSVLRSVVEPDDRWRGLVDELMGWADPGADALPALGSTAHVRAHDLGPGGPTPSLLAAAGRASRRSATADRAGQVACVGAMAVGAVLSGRVPLLILCALPLVVWLAAVLLANRPRRWAHRPLTRQLVVEHGVADRDAAWLAFVLLASGVAVSAAPPGVGAASPAVAVAPRGPDRRVPFGPPTASGPAPTLDPESPPPDPVG